MLWIIIPGQYSGNDSYCQISLLLTLSDFFKLIPGNFYQQTLSDSLTLVGFTKGLQSTQGDNEMLLFINLSFFSFHCVGKSFLFIHKKCSRGLSNAGLDMLKVNMNGKQATYLISSTSSEVKDVPNFVLHSSVKFSVSHEILFLSNFLFFSRNFSQKMLLESSSFVNLNFAYLKWSIV